MKKIFLFFLAIAIFGNFLFLAEAKADGSRKITFSPFTPEFLKDRVVFKMKMIGSDQETSEIKGFNIEFASRKQMQKGERLVAKNSTYDSKAKIWTTVFYGKVKMEDVDYVTWKPHNGSGSCGMISLSMQMNNGFQRHIRNDGNQIGLQVTKAFIGDGNVEIRWKVKIPVGWKTAKGLPWPGTKNLDKMLWVQIYNISPDCIRNIFDSDDIEYSKDLGIILCYPKYDNKNKDWVVKFQYDANGDCRIFKPNFIIHTSIINNANTKQEEWIDNMR